MEPENWKNAAGIPRPETIVLRGNIIVLLMGKTFNDGFFDLSLMIMMTTKIMMMMMFMLFLC